MSRHALAHHAFVARRPSVVMRSIRMATLFAVHLLATVVSANDVVVRPVTPRGPLAPGELATIELFERAKHSVVYLSTSQRVIDLWSRNVLTIPRGTGSGFVWDERGHIVTNYHVVAGAAAAQVRLNDGRELAARLVGASPAHDVAVLQLATAATPPPLPLGTSHDLRVGQSVFAIGNPFGLDWTLTVGIVSALDRSLPAENGRSIIEHLIQTDAAINPGNSGGPLLDSAGRLIGVNTAIFSPSGASAGVGFAVPVDTLNRVVPQLIARGRYVRPSFGAEFDEAFNRIVTAHLQVKGVAVLRVQPGSGAARAGLRGVTRAPDGSLVPGDIVIAVEGRSVESVARLRAVLDDYEVGRRVRVTVWRNGQTRELAITLQADG